ncbi:MAG: hypothetical protein ACRBN8_30550 [Nannocystales bacterium]
MAEPTKLAISGATFASIRDHLDDGFGLFEDGDFLYAVLDAKTHAIDVLRRTDERTWTELSKEQLPSVRVCINGQLFGPGGLYGSAATGPLTPTRVEGQGSIRQGGVTFPEDPIKGEKRYFFGRSRNGDRYTCYLGNPPDDIYEGMGGLGPLIITNPVTGVGLPSGVGNRYLSDASNTSIPETDEAWTDCTQRNSRHFRQIDVEDPNEFCAVAASSSTKLLLVVASRSDAPGQLSALRDKLLDAGFDCAAFTDGSNSSSFVVDGDVLVKPHFIKDNLIEAGFKGVKGSKPVSLRITFKTLKVLDAAFIEGDQGLWTIIANVNGVEAGAIDRAVVVEGDVLQLGWVLELEVSSSNELRIEVKVHNMLGPLVTGDSPPSISDFDETTNIASNPPFGEGAWTVTNRDDFYTFRYEIEVL